MSAGHVGMTASDGSTLEFDPSPENIKHHLRGDESTVRDSLTDLSAPLPRNPVGAARRGANSATCVRAGDAATVQPALPAILNAAMVIAAAFRAWATTVLGIVTLDAARRPAAAADGDRAAFVTAIVIAIRTAARHIAGTAVLAARPAALAITAASPAAGASLPASLSRACFAQSEQRGRSAEGEAGHGANSSAPRSGSVDTPR